MLGTIVHTIAHFGNYTTINSPFTTLLFETNAGLTGFVLLLIMAVIYLGKSTDPEVNLSSVCMCRCAYPCAFYYYYYYYIRIIIIIILIIFALHTEFRLQALRREYDGLAMKQEVSSLSALNFSERQLQNVFLLTCMLFFFLQKILSSVDCTATQCFSSPTTFLWFSLSSSSSTDLTLSTRTSGRY